MGLVLGITMKQYVSTSTLCSVYEVDASFFLRRKHDGIFVEKKHFIQQGNTLRWDFESIENWWRGESSENSMKNKILAKVLVQ